MNLLQFSLAYAPSWKNGGLSRVMFDYARELSRRGCNVSVYTSDASRPLKERASDWPADLEMSYFKSYGGPLAKFYFDYSPIEISSWLSANLPRFDAVHLAQTRTIANIALHAAAVRTGTPYVLSSFGSLPRRSHGIKTIYDALFVSTLIRDAAALFAQTEHEAAVYREFGGRDAQIRLVPLAFNEPDFEHLPQRGSLRVRLGIPDDAPVVLFLGRLHYFKGSGLLLDAFARVQRTNKRAVLVIVGATDADRSRVAGEIGARGLNHCVHLVSAIYGADRLAAYCDADVYAITPLVYEETPLAAIEALATGTPVVTTEKASIPGLNNSGAGFVCPPDDIERIAESIQEMLERSAEGPARRAWVRRFAAEHFGLSHIGGLLKNEFSRVARGNR